METLMALIMSLGPRVWTIAERQVAYETWVHGIGTALLLAAIAGSIACCLFCLRKFRIGTDSEIWLIPIVFCVMIFLLLGLGLMETLSEFVGRLVNPDYYAIKALLVK
ncbi:MAG: hypothetical protein A2W25_11735 [candidate division Zixibacteria bacterium RBG_16_53_22]|nr:MAG: hypothetical protein A2W25_11735 [candidate division Zixibacteria bacterium RBG_16_53_22]